jgi:RNA 2',3'-cyclic 3'-phosphodiesterase
VRLFVGITPTSEALAHAAGGLPEPAPDLRWLPEQRWHVTLAFLGEVDPDRIPDLAARLDAVAAEHAPLEGLRLAGAGTFRGVLWLGIEPTERHSPADRLARAVQREMRAVGIPVERCPWHAHLTLARWRPSADRDALARQVAHSLAGYVGPEFDVHEIHLVHSITGPMPSHSDVHVARLGD